MPVSPLIYLSHTELLLLSALQINGHGAIFVTDILDGMDGNGTVVGDWPETACHGFE